MTPPGITQAPAAAADTTRLAQIELARWQRKQLPFMSRFMVVLAIGFFAISAIDVYETRLFIKNESTSAIRNKVDEVLQPLKDRPNVDPVVRTLLLLEADTLEKRYRQASALLLSRISTRQLAFITGMVLAFIGAVFIIGKLSESSSDVSLGASEWKAGITSSSPGLILAFFGTVLIGIALVVQPQIEVQDRPVYITTVGVVQNTSAAPAAKAAPSAFPDPFGDSASPQQAKQSKGK